jgi:hypothetical protein
VCKKEYGDVAFRLYNDLKAKIREAWDVVATPGLLRELIEGMED